MCNNTIGSSDIYIEKDRLQIWHIGQYNADTAEDYSSYNIYEPLSQHWMWYIYEQNNIAEGVKHARSNIINQVEATSICNRLDSFLCIKYTGKKLKWPCIRI